MPSHLHETIIEMVRERPALVADLLGPPLGVAVPEFDSVTLSSGDLTAVEPTEARADAVVTFDVDEEPALAVIVEVQRRYDPGKQYSWPMYVATLFRRLKCPVLLLVICLSRSAARQCSVPIVVGDSWLVLRPTVLGPDQVPRVTDGQTVRRAPELAILSTLAHAGDADPRPVFEGLMSAYEIIGAKAATRYTNFILSVLRGRAREALEGFMLTDERGSEVLSDLAQRYLYEGEAKGRAKGEAIGQAKGEAIGQAKGEAIGQAKGEAIGQAKGEAIGQAKGEAIGQAFGTATDVLEILDVRGVPVPDEARQKIVSCTDLAQLRTWLRRAVTAGSISDLAL